MEWISTDSIVKKGGQTAFLMKWRAPDGKVVTFTVVEEDTVDGIVQEFVNEFACKESVVMKWKRALALHFPRKIGRFFVY